MNRQIFGGLAFGLVWTVQTFLAQENAMERQKAAMERQQAQTQAAMESSIRKQITSVRKQQASAGEVDAYFVLPAELPRAAPQPVCDSLSPMTIQQMAGKAATSNQISTDLVMAVIQQESAFRPCAVSSKGALGLMQLMPTTAAELGVNDAFDAEQNIAGGAKLLKKLLTRYEGDLNRALGAYSAGPSSVDTYGGIPPFPETENYVDTITRSLEASERAH